MFGDIYINIRNCIRQWLPVLMLPLLSLFVVYLFCGEIARHSGFSKGSDIIGYPLFANYNNYGPLYGYVVGILVANIIVYLIVNYVSIEKWRDLRIISAEYLLVALVFGASAGVLRGGQSSVYILEAYIILYVVRSFLSLKYTLEDKSSVSISVDYYVLSLFSLALPFVLYKMSRKTGWEDSGGFIHVEWFPLIMLFIGVTVVLWLIVRAWLKNVEVSGFRQKILALIYLPVIIYFLLAYLPLGVSVGGDYFHSGEKFGPLALSLKGLIP
ncbi:MAG: hypothetical protein HGB35_07235, partial [Geobacteraceae bacterium]|nr:hypothetical protein [Geobacteraceae bacterium]